MQVKIFEAIRAFNSKLEDFEGVRSAIINDAYTDQAIIKIIHDLFGEIDKNSRISRYEFNGVINLAEKERPALKGNLPKRIK